MKKCCGNNDECSCDNDISDDDNNCCYNCHKLKNINVTNEKIFSDNIIRDIIINKYFYEVLNGENKEKNIDKYKKYVKNYENINTILMNPCDHYSLIVKKIFNEREFKFKIYLNEYCIKIPKDKMTNVNEVINYILEKQNKIYSTYFKKNNYIKLYVLNIFNQYYYHTIQIDYPKSYNTVQQIMSYMNYSIESFIKNNKKMLFLTKK